MSKFIIIAGSHKSGTTSLFNYLSQHDAINESVIKQTFYFMDKEYFDDDGVAALKNVHDHPGAYFSLFSHTQDNDVFLESTPDYMYFPSVAKRMAESLIDHDLMVLFILRNPVDRFLSWYRFSKQIGFLADDVSCSQYLIMNKEAQPDSLNFKKEHIIRYALETGFYSKYIHSFLDHLPRVHSKIVFFEELVKDPLLITNDILNENGLRPIDCIDGKVYNKTKELRSVSIHSTYMYLRKLGIKLMASGKVGEKVVNIGKSVLAPLYHGLNYKESAHDTSHDVIKEISEIYNEEIAYWKMNYKNCNW